MSTRSLCHVIAAVIAALFLSSLWYISFGSVRADLLDVSQTASSHPAAWQIMIEIVRTLAVTLAVGAAIQRLAIRSSADAIRFVSGAFVAFPGALLLGSVIWDGVPPGLAAIHAGDWLIKLTLVTLVMRRCHLNANRPVSIRSQSLHRPAQAA